MRGNSILFFFKTMASGKCEKWRPVLWVNLKKKLNFNTLRPTSNLPCVATGELVTPAFGN
jgi:hypothetical protein